MIQPGTLLLATIAVSLFTIGLACLIAHTNLIKMVMGIEFCGKGVSLLFILGGFLAGDMAHAQAVVFTLIAIEAVVAGLALALVILAKRFWKTFDTAGIYRFTGGGGP